MFGCFYVYNDGITRISDDKLYFNSSQLRTPQPTAQSDLRSFSSTYDPCYVSESTDCQTTFRSMKTFSNVKFKVLFPPEEATKMETSSMTVQFTPLSADFISNHPVTGNQHGCFYPEISI